MLTPGQDHDLTCAQPLLENTTPGTVIADKAYDADALIDKLTEQGVTPVIPPSCGSRMPNERGSARSAIDWAARPIRESRT
jgi:transposase